MAARPLLAVSLAYLCGAGLGAWLPQEPAAWAWAAGALLAGWAALLAGGRREAGRRVGMAGFAVLGLVRCQLDLAPLYAGAEQFPAGEATALGRISRVALGRGGETLLLLEDVRVRREATTVALTLPLQLVLAGVGDGYAVGDTVVARGALRPLRGDRNLGWFPGPAVPRANRCAARLTVEGPAGLRRLGHDPGRGPGAAVLRWRAAADRFWASRPGAGGAILNALTTGERGGIPVEVQEAFTRAGLAHLLAISGMNVGFLAALVFLLLRRTLALCAPLALRFPVQPLAAGLTLPALWFFLLFSGGQIPVGRAVLSCGAALAAAVAWRRIAPAEALALAALAIVAGDPRAAFSPSFQLSFAATAALLLVAPRLARERGPEAATGASARWAARLGSGVRELCLASFAAAAATAPLVAFHFQQLSLIGLAANLVAVPLAGFAVLPAAWLALVCAGLPQVASDAVVGLALGSAESLIAVARWFAQPGWASLETARPPALLTLSLLGVVAALLPPPRVRRRTACAVALGAASVGGGCWAIGTAGGGMLVAVLDVGQGLAAAVRVPGGGMHLYDAGPRWREYDAGERVVVPALRRLGTWRLASFSVSHGHPDHAGGGGAVRRSLAPAAELTGAGARLRGFERELGGGVRLRVLNPGAPSGGPADENDRSLALLVSFGETGFVLTGDAGPSVVAGIAAAAQPHPRRIALQAPHHGGSTEACRALAVSLRPEVSVIPVGRNGYGHPKAGAEAALGEQGRVLRTDRDGAVFIGSDGARFTVRTWRELALRRSWWERWRWLAAGW